MLCCCFLSIVLDQFQDFITSVRYMYSRSNLVEPVGFKSYNNLLYNCNVYFHLLFNLKG